MEISTYVVSASLHKDDTGPVCVVNPLFDLFFETKDTSCIKET